MEILHSAIAILAAILLIIRFKVDPVISLLLACVYLGLATGQGAEGTVAQVTGGFGEIMAEVGLLIGFGVLIVPWMMHGMGAGDVKLMAAIGAWLGPWLTVLSFGAGAVIGGVAAIIMILSTGRAAYAVVNLQTIMTKMKRFDTAFGEYGGAKTFGTTSQLLPYGVPLTAGTICVLMTYYFGGWLG